VILIVAGLGLLHIVPLTGSIGDIEKLLSERLQEPVNISFMRFALFPTPRLLLEHVVVGKVQDAQIEEVIVPLTSLSLFAQNKHLSEVRLSTITIDQDVVPRMVGWVDARAGKQNLQIDRLELSAVTLTLRGIKLPSFDGTIGFGSDGVVQEISLREPRLSIEFKPAEDRTWQANFKASGWRPPLGWDVEFTELSGNARISYGLIALTRFDGRLYRGSIKGAATIKWGGSISAEGRFAMEGADLAPLLQALRTAFNASGTLDTSVTFASQGQKATELFAAPRVNATFTLRKGVLDNVDVLRALQSPGRAGKTPFDVISGDAQVSANRIAYRNVSLSSGRMKANGAIEVSPNAELSGRINVLVGTPDFTAARGVLNVTGTLKSPLLSP
jgi:hypothetical protein